MSELTQILEGYNIGFPPQAKYGVIDKKKLVEYMELMKADGQIATIPPVDAIVTDIGSGFVMDDYVMEKKL